MFTRGSLHGSDINDIIISHGAKHFVTIFSKTCNKKLHFVFNLHIFFVMPYPLAGQLLFILKILSAFYICYIYLNTHQISFIFGVFYVEDVCWGHLVLVPCVCVRMCFF